MINTIPPGEHDRIHIIGRSQGYLGLAVAFGTVVDETTGAEAPCLTTAYKPTPAELERLNAGEPVRLRYLYLTPNTPIVPVIGDVRLSFQFDAVVDETTNENVPCATAEYQPTIDDVVRLNEDGSLVVALHKAWQHPPVAVWVSRR